MPIIYQDPSYAQATLGMAALAGQHKAAEAAAERSQQMSIAAMEVQSRRELAQFEADVRLQAAKLSQAWELEKMQRESELDFQQKQKELTLTRDAYYQKQAIAKEEYQAYVDYIDNDNTKDPEEKAQFKQMAYDKKVAKIDLADQVYFPGKYRDAAGKGGGIQRDAQGNIIGFGGGPDTSVSQPSVPAGTPASVSELQAAMVQVNRPDLSLDQVIDAAKSVAKPAVVQNIAARLSESAKGQLTEEQIMAQANKMADTELAVQEGFVKSKKMGQVAAPTVADVWRKITTQPTRVMEEAGFVTPQSRQYFQGAVQGLKKFAKWATTKVPKAEASPHQLAVMEQEAADRARSKTKLGVLGKTITKLVTQEMEPQRIPLRKRKRRKIMKPISEDIRRAGSELYNELGSSDRPVLRTKRKRRSILSELWPDIRRTGSQLSQELGE